MDDVFSTHCITHILVVITIFSFFVHGLSLLLLRGALFLFSTWWKMIGAWVVEMMRVMVAGRKMDGTVA